MERPTLVTKRLIIKPFQACDAQRVKMLAGDYRVAETTLAIPFPYLDGVAEQWISTHEDDFSTGKSLVLAIRLVENDELIGALGLILKQDHQLAELGYWIGVDFWNKGYCTEACCEILNYGFSKLSLNKIIAYCFSGNKASIRVLEKLGMKKEAYHRKHLKHWGEFKDLYAYGVLRDEFV